MDDRRTDVLVAGGGMAGVYAALGAARAGARVILVESAGFLGGQATVGGVHTFCGDTELVNDDWRRMLENLDTFDGGIAPFRPNDDGRRFDAESLKFVTQDLVEAAGVEVMLHATTIGAHRQGEQLQYVLVHDVSGVHRLRAAQFIDATGDADVVSDAGWESQRGGPSFAPGPTGVERIAERLPLPMSLYFAMVDTGRPVVPAVPPGGPTWAHDDDLPMTSVSEHGGVVTVKMKVIGFDATNGASLSAAEHHARRQALALVAHLQTAGYLGRRYPHHRLVWIAPRIGLREGRRIRAEVELGLHHLLSGADFEDAVAVGSYHIDYHWPADVRRAGTGLTAQVPPYQIPLGAMRPAGSGNVLVPGRCMGGEQIAMSSFRVMAICAQTGFGAGSAAGLAVTSGSTLDGLDLVKLRALLRRGGVRLDRAPYLRYLRARRTYSWSLNLEGVDDVAVALAPNGAVVAVAARADGAWLSVLQPTGAGAPILLRAGPIDSVTVVVDLSRVYPPAPGDLVVESDDPGPIVLGVRGPGFDRSLSIDLRSGKLAESGAISWPSTRELEVPANVWSPYADTRPLRLRLRNGVMERSIGDAPWESTPIVAGEGPVAIAPTAGGVLVASATPSEVLIQHVPFDQVLGLEAGHPTNEHNTGLDWLDLLHEGATE